VAAYKACNAVLLAGVVCVAFAGTAAAQFFRVGSSPVPKQPRPPSAEDVSLGQDLFHHTWAKNDRISPYSGDGLGPLYNAHSCDACHHQRGSGGGGDNRHNVQLLSLELLDEQPPEAEPVHSLTDVRGTVFPRALRSSASVVLHRHSVDEDYAKLRDEWASWGPVKRLEATSFFIRKKGGGTRREVRTLAAVRTERNTPALFGVGWIDQLQPHELRAAAKFLNGKYPEVSGRVAPGGGKFGWRGQSDSLRGFVVGACANELGLQTDGVRQPNDPSVGGDRHNSVDMYPEQVDALVEYVAEMPPPVEEVPEEGTDDHASWLRGKRYFAAARCTACHIRQIGSVVGLYSDLLLHDMGPELRDPAALVPAESPSERRVSSAYGVSRTTVAAIVQADLVKVTDEQKQEWRTPPLWGVRHSPPYLHDGRAETVGEAIRLHRGEARHSSRFFKNLKPRAQADLVAYVKSLGAPEE